VVLSVPAQVEAWNRGLLTVLQRSLAERGAVAFTFSS